MNVNTSLYLTPSRSIIRQLLSCFINIIILIAWTIHREIDCHRPKKSDSDTLQLTIKAKLRTSIDYICSEEMLVTRVAKSDLKIMVIN